MSNQMEAMAMATIIINISKLRENNTNANDDNYKDNYTTLITIVMMMNGNNKL